MPQPLVAIVGRPNVGKSTLFNRLVGGRIAIVDDTPGTTRDRIAAQITWADHDLTLVDTGGLEPRPESPLWEKMKAQVEQAVEEADVIIFVVDTTQGVTPADMEIAQMLRRKTKTVVLAANKADGLKKAMTAVEFYELGLDDPIAISAYHNTGVADLMDKVLEKLPELPPASTDDAGAMHLAIVGRPNVGKSLLYNAILGQDRAIVSEMPGTTRDPIDTHVTYQDQPMVLIDTAGIRRSGQVQQGVERYSVLRALRAIDRSDVAFLVLDASELVTAQDTHVAGYLAESYKGVVIVVNKWDLMSKLGLDWAGTIEEIRRRFRFMPYAPVCFASALERWGIAEAMDIAVQVYVERHKEVSPTELRSVLLDALANHPPPSEGRRYLKIKKAVQEGVNPPTFAFYVNHPDMVHFSYQRYLENKLRVAFGFARTHIRLVFKGRTQQ